MPALSALRAFEAAGRLGGFAQAAQELGVSPAAITQHLKALESTLGVALFTRSRRGVELTEIGAQVLPEFTEAFRLMDKAIHRLEGAARPDMVRIATTPDLAALWLSPRLGPLRDKGLRVLPVPVAGTEAVKAAGADLSLFMEPGEGGCVVLAASDWAWAKGEDLPERELIRLAGPLGDWGPWLAAAGVRRVPRGPVYDQAALAIEEAANGAGAVMLPVELAARAVETRGLVLVRGLTAPFPFEAVLRRVRRAPRGSAAAKVFQALGARD